MSVIITAANKEIDESQQMKTAMNVMLYCVCVGVFYIYICVCVNAYHIARHKDRHACTFNQYLTAETLFDSIRCISVENCLMIRL